eukprot:515133_1
MLLQSNASYKDYKHIQVCASCYDNNNYYIFDNSLINVNYKYDKYHKFREELIQKINHYPKAYIHFDEFISDKLIYEQEQQHMLSCHAEKKALSFLIYENVQNIEIIVSMIMCYDCHHFFCNVSKQYPNINISVIDPQQKHEFVKGICCCRKKWGVNTKKKKKIILLQKVKS